MSTNTGSAKPKSYKKPLLLYLGYLAALAATVMLEIQGTFKEFPISVSLLMALGIFGVNMLFDYIWGRNTHAKLDEMKADLGNKLDVLIATNHVHFSDLNKKLDDLPERIAKAMVKEMEKAFPGLKHLPVPDKPKNHTNDVPSNLTHDEPMEYGDKETHKPAFPGSSKDISKT